MVKITRIFKKYKFAWHNYIARAFGSFINDRIIIDYLNNNKTIKIGVGSDMIGDIFKNNTTADITFIDSDENLIVNLMIDDIYSDYEIKLLAKNVKVQQITHPYYDGDATIIISDEIGFYITPKEKYHTDETFKYKISKKFKLDTLNDFNFVLFEKSNFYIELDLLKYLILNIREITILNSFNENISTHSCSISCKIIQDENIKYFDVSAFNNIDNIDDYILFIEISGYKHPTHHKINDSVIRELRNPDVRIILKDKNNSQIIKKE